MIWEAKGNNVFCGLRDEAIASLTRRRHLQQKLVILPCTLYESVSVLVIWCTCVIFGNAWSHHGCTWYYMGFIWICYDCTHFMLDHIYLYSSRTC
jgi:hypothetical protein